jgi:hypothetical protein
MGCVAVHASMPGHEVRELAHRLWGLHNLQIWIMSLMQRNALRHSCNQVRTGHGSHGHRKIRDSKGAASVQSTRRKTLIGYCLRPPKDGNSDV